MHDRFKLTFPAQQLRAVQLQADRFNLVFSFNLPTSGDNLDQPIWGEFNEEVTRHLYRSGIDLPSAPGIDSTQPPDDPSDFLYSLLQPRSHHGTLHYSPHGKFTSNDWTIRNFRKSPFGNATPNHMRDEHAGGIFIWIGMFPPII